MAHEESLRSRLPQVQLRAASSDQAWLQVGYAGQLPLRRRRCERGQAGRARAGSGSALGVSGQLPPAFLQTPRLPAAPSPLLTLRKVIRVHSQQRCSGRGWQNRPPFLLSRWVAFSGFVPRGSVLEAWTGRNEECSSSAQDSRGCFCFAVSRSLAVPRSIPTPFPRRCPALFCPHLGVLPRSPNDRRPSEEP